MNPLPVTGVPFPFGITFVPTEALGPVVGASRGRVADLVEACRVLRASFAFVPAEWPEADEVVAALAEADVAPLVAFSGPLWPLLEAKGVTEGLRETLTHPEETAAELGARVDSLVAAVAHAAEGGARAVVLAEDLAGSEGPLVAPDFAIGELMPLYERVVRAARSLGMPAVFHSDGDVRAIMPAIARAGFAAVHAGGGLRFDAFERLFWTAREAGLAVVGGLLTSELANPARAEALGSRLGVLAKAGGLLVADDGGIQTAEEIAALVVALTAARDL
jgi:hypothetical protein